MTDRTLKNPLDNFATYSIHHILLACRTTEDAKIFIDDTGTRPADTLSAIGEVKQLGDPVPIGTGDSAFLVIDTRRFSQFAVERLEYEVFINGLEKAGSHGNLATTVDMVVSDTVGISFINFIQWLMNEKMQTNFDGMIFMHRVIFVGHHPDGKTETVQSVTIPMHLFKMELSLDAMKGTYTMQFMPNMNFDVRDHHRWLTIHNATSYFTGGINNLGALVDSFEKQLNKVSEDYYNEVHKRMKDANRITDSDQFGRKVQYQITIPGEWRKYKVIGANNSNATETDFKKLLEQNNKKPEDKTEQAAVDKKAGQPLDTNVSVESDRQITDVLDFMFRQVPEISELGAGKKTTGTEGSVTFYKHFVGITSDNNNICIHVDVVPFRVPNLLVDGSGGNKTEGSAAAVGANDSDFYQAVGDDGIRRPNNYMEFDYIFTGKNKDVLSFDMKLQDLQWMLASQLNLGPGLDGVTENQKTGVVPVKDETAGKVNERSELILSRPYDAILVPKKSLEELENFTQYTKLLDKDIKRAAIKASNNYMANLSMYYAMAPITAIMVIRGNPLIMTKFNQNKLLEHPGTNSIQTSSTSADDLGPHGKYRQSFEEQILRDNFTDGGEQQLTNTNGTFDVVKSLGSASYAMAPVFVTVNVKGPNVQHYPGQKVSDDFAEKILTDNYYVVFRVKNRIEGNAFTQELELYSHNVFGNGKVTLPSDAQVK